MAGLKNLDPSQLWVNKGPTKNDAASCKSTCCSWTACGEGFKWTIIARQSWSERPPEKKDGRYAGEKGELLVRFGWWIHPRLPKPAIRFGIKMDWSVVCCCSGVAVTGDCQWHDTDFSDVKAIELNWIQYKTSVELISDQTQLQYIIAYMLHVRLNRRIISTPSCLTIPRIMVNTYLSSRFTIMISSVYNSTPRAPSASSQQEYNCREATPPKHPNDL